MIKHFSVLAWRSLGRLFPLLLAAGCLGGITAYADEKIPSLTAVTDNLPLSVDERGRFSEQRAHLLETLAAFKTRARAFDAMSAEQQTDAEFKELQAERSNYIKAAKDFNNELADAIERAEQKSRINFSTNQISRESQAAHSPPDRDSIARTAVQRVAAGVRVREAYEKYDKEHAGHINSLDRIAAGNKAAAGEGYTKEEIRKQEEKALLEWHKKYGNDPSHWPAGGSEPADEIIIGGKG